MEFWIVWLIGIVVVIATRIAINICQRDTYTYEKSKIARIIINLLIIICIVIDYTFVTYQCKIHLEQFQDLEERYKLQTILHIGI